MSYGLLLVSLSKPAQIPSHFKKSLLRTGMMSHLRVVAARWRTSLFENTRDSTRDEIEWEFSRSTRTQILAVPSYTPTLHIREASA